MSCYHRLVQRGLPADTAASLPLCAQEEVDREVDGWRDGESAEQSQAQLEGRPARSVQCPSPASITVVIKSEAPLSDGTGGGGRTGSTGPPQSRRLQVTAPYLPR